MKNNEKNKGNNISNNCNKINNKRMFDCNKCGRNHGINEFPAYGKKCRKCRLNNNFKVNCKNKNKNVNSIVVDTNCLSLNTVEIFEIKSKNKYWRNKILIENID